jgi:hypothetical protein
MIFFDERRIILDNSWIHQHVTSTLDYTNIQKLIFHLNCTHTLNSSRSQNQTCTTLCSMDNRTGKHSAKGLRIDVQRTTANIHVSGVEKLVLSGVFLLLSATKNEED